MMALLWDDILADIAIARGHFTQAADIYDRHLAPTMPPGSPPDYMPAMAFQHAMQAGYTSFEAAMKRLLALMDEPVPAGADWHTALLRRLGRSIEGRRPAMFDAASMAVVSELRRFRHVAMHAYDDFTPSRAAEPVRAARAFADTIEGRIARFRAAVDPD